MQHVAPTDYSSFGDPILPPEVFGHIATYADSQTAGNIRRTGTWGKEVLEGSCRDLARTRPISWEDVTSYLGKMYDDVLNNRIAPRRVWVHLSTNGAFPGLDNYILEMRVNDPEGDVTHCTWVNGLVGIKVPLYYVKALYEAGRVYLVQADLKEIVRAMYPACVNRFYEFYIAPAVYDLLEASRTYAQLIDLFASMGVSNLDLGMAKEVAMTVLVETEKREK